ncbi:hypothetical protein GCM10011505_45310 [Tistrella bauzanensis]|uniref:Branched-chain amino acid transport protein (AzlD) n=1 Tax=Tistrella bauzanensis TaxID=657419 RepID=A0ABQ1J4D3_9PROT|nr:hypothetical protein [Tistrella bauzanensis]GGB59487.1 hypothetical protein GCM10011505_45310 [Tistrella bauzanensis]
MTMAAGFDPVAMLGVPLTGILLLGLVSVLVRVLPAYLPLPTSPATRRRIEVVLPVAVFINLAIYCAAGEIGTATRPALAGFATLALLFPWRRRLPFILLVLIPSGVYVAALKLSGG